MGFLRVIKFLIGLIIFWYVFWIGLVVLIAIVGWNEVEKEKKEREPILQIRLLVRHRFVEPIKMVRFHHLGPYIMETRLTAGQRSLKASVGVRIPGLHPIFTIAKGLFHAERN